jgi:hypothetical protein
MALSSTSLLELPATSIHLIPLALKHLICVWSPCDLGALRINDIQDGDIIFDVYIL